MALAPWPTTNWPEGVPREISGYEKPVYSILDESAEKYPGEDYTVFMGGTRTFAQVKDAADRIANFLASRGIGKGDPVAIFLPNLPHYPAVYFGILKAGAVCVTCNPMYTASELNYQLRDAEAKAVFCMDHPVYYPTAVEAIKRTKVDTVVICGVKSYVPWLKGFFGSLIGKIPKADAHEPGHLFFDDVVSAATPEPPVVEINPTEDLAVIIYTGGTTGVPKGAAITHASFVFNVMALHEWFRIPQVKGGPSVQIEPGGANCFMAALPFYHSFGMTVIMLWSCFTGSRVVCIPDPRAGNPPFTEVLKALEKHRVTIFTGVPTMFVAVANHPLLDKFDLTSIRGCGSGGAPMPMEVAKQFEEKTGAIIFEAYGLSETSPLATANPCNKDTRKFGSVGFPISNTVVAIVDTETGLETLPQGEDGEIAINGPQVMRGYWQNETADAEVFREIDGKRFFLTGDIGHIDDNGYILITDRKKDLILVGGFNCYPREVEEALYAHPKVSNAAVIGIPDPKSGEAVKAFVQLKPGEEATEQELLDFCRQNLAGYKRPRTIEFRDDLPTSVVGKVLRRVLRDEELAKHDR